MKKKILGILNCINQNKYNVSNPPPVTARGTYPQNAGPRHNKPVCGLVGGIHFRGAADFMAAKPHNGVFHKLSSVHAQYSARQHNWRVEKKLDKKSPSTVITIFVGYSRE